MIYFAKYALDVLDNKVHLVGHIFAAYLACHLMVLGVLLRVVQQRLPQLVGRMQVPRFSPSWLRFSCSKLFSNWKRLSKESLWFFGFVPRQHLFRELVQVSRVLHFDFGALLEKILQLVQNRNLRVQPLLKTFDALIQLRFQICLTKMIQFQVYFIW